MISYERKEEMMNALRGSSFDPEPSVQGETAPDNNVPEVDENKEASSLNEQQETSAPSVSDDNNSLSSGEDEGHRVPYKRFKSVVEARNEYQQEVNSLREQLQSYEERLASARKSDTTEDVSSDWDWLESHSDDDYEETGSFENERFAELNSRIEKFELFQAEQALEKEIQQVTSDYPGVPEQVLLQAVVNDPDVALRKVAEAYSSFVASTEEQAIARYLEENKAPTPAPRGNSKGSSPAQGLVPTENKKISSVSEGSKALRALLKGRNGPIF